MASAGVLHVAPDSRTTTTRSTVDGRRLTYQLSVIQQPERARACGQGAKSSTDRRPVDPPPIIELRVFEGDEGNRTDVTFSHRANFFLHASLEPARGTVHGRAAPDPSTSQIVAGMSVSGMAYLDRPTPAGYFIYSDLSVRHEGQYRLAFTLFEELKEPRDAEPATDHRAPEPSGEHFSCRASVRTLPFTVYSAKKFPGLAESTALSRTVADQGCRVRIRRDVRMRRRDTKSGKDFDDYDDDDAVAGDDQPAPESFHAPRGHAAVGPPPPQHPVSEAPERPKSVDNPYRASSHAHGLQPLRVPSPHDMGNPFYYQQGYGQATQQPQHGYHQPPQMQYAPASMTAYQHQQYMGGQPLYQSPTSTISPYSSISHSYDRSGEYGGQRQYMQATPWDYGMHGHGRYETYPPAYAPQLGHAYEQHPPPQAQYPHSASGVPLGPAAETASGHGRTSTQDPPPPPPPPQPYHQHHPPQQQHHPPPPPPPSQQQQHQRHSSVSASTAPTSNNGTEPPHQSSSSSYPASPPAPSHYAGMPAPPPPPPQYVTSTAAQLAAGPRAGKRLYSAAFDTTHTDTPLHQGRRPSPSRSASVDGAGFSSGTFGAGSTGVGYGGSSVPPYSAGAGAVPEPQSSVSFDGSSDEDPAEFEDFKMCYRRADGTEITRGWPLYS